MKTIVMGKKIKRNYEVKAETDDKGKFKYRPFIKELNSDIEWEEICNYEGEAQISYRLWDDRYINISEDEEVRVTKEIFRADLGNYIQYTDKILEEDEGNKADCEESLKIYIKEFNRERIENDSEAKAYCDLHKLNYEDTDYDELMKYIHPNKVIDDNGLDRLEKTNSPTMFEVGDVITYGFDSIEGYVLNPNYSEGELVASMENTACPQILHKKECYKTGKKKNNTKDLLGL